METTAKRSLRAAAAHARKTVAQKLCNHVAHDRARALDGAAAVNLFRAGALQPLGLDLLHPMVLARLRKDPRWAPPKGSLNAALVVAMLISRWSLPKSHPHAGERYTGILASNEQMAELAGCHPDTWARYGRPFLEELKILVGVPTTVRPHAGWRSRTGASMPHRESRTLYVPDDALYDLLARRDRRIDRSRRTLLAEARRQLSQGRKNSDPKAPEKSLSTKDIFSGRARGRTPLAHQLLATHRRRRRTVRPTAVSTVQATPPPPPSMSPAPAVDETACDSQRLATKGAGAGASPGGELETERQRAPVAQEAAQAPPDVSAEPPPTNTLGASPATAPDGDGEDAVVKELLTGLYARFGDVIRTPPPPTPTRHREPLPGRGIGELMRQTERRVRQLVKGGAAPPARAAPLGGLFGGDERNAQERAENERRRQEALQRARREADLGSDPPPGGGDDSERRR